MSIGLVGRKLGMTRVFNENGKSVPVTVIQVEANRVTQVKNAETDGYNAIQVTTGSRKASRINKPEAGHFAKAKVEAGRGLWEFRLSESELAAYQVGSEIKVDVFKDVKKVDVTGQSKGKGTAGTIKRYHFLHQDFTHGNSRSHRVPGSTGQNQTRAACSRERGWSAIWEARRLPLWTLSLFASIQTAICSSLRAPFPVPTTGI